MDYQAYISSVEWRLFRDHYFSVHEKECLLCHSQEKVELHHHTYVRLGCEDPGDVVPLCSRYHIAVHDLHKKKRKYQSLTESTFEYISCHSRKVVETTCGDKPIILADIRRQMKLIAQSQQKKQKALNKKKNKKKAIPLVKEKSFNPELLVSSGRPIYSSGYQGPKRIIPSSPCSRSGVYSPLSD